MFVGIGREKVIGERDRIRAVGAASICSRVMSLFAVMITERVHVIEQSVLVRVIRFGFRRRRLVEGNQRIIE